MKRNLRLVRLLLAGVLLLCMAPAAVLADYNYDGVATPHIIVIDGNDLAASNPIYERAADERLYPASTTKILTCIVAIENGNLDANVTVGEEIKGLYELKNGYTANSSLMGLVQGETLTLRDLLYGLMLVSGNEAADAIAVAVGGSIENFVSMMNAKAQELGMTNSHFMNPNGVNHDEHYTTARDMAKLTAYALNNPTFAEIVKTAVYNVPANDVRTTELKLVNSNLLLTAEDAPQYASYPYPYCIGVKTGLTTKAGSCLIAAAEQDGARAIVCLYGDSIETKGDQLQRFTTAKGIFEDLFQNVYTTVTGDQLSLQSTFFCTVERGRPEDLNENGQLEITVNPSGLTMRVLTSELEKLKTDPAGITANVEWTDSLSAPIRQGQYLGTVTYSYNGKEIFSTDLSAPKDVLEVAVLAAPADPDADGDGQPDAAATASLLTEPTAGDAAKPKGMSPLLLTVLILLGLLVVIAVISALVSARKRKQKRLRQQRRRAQMQRQQAARQGQAQRRPAQQQTQRMEAGEGARPRRSTGDAGRTRSGSGAATQQRRRPQ